MRHTIRREVWHIHRKRRDKENQPPGGTEVRFKRYFKGTVTNTPRKLRETLLEEAEGVRGPCLTSKAAKGQMAGLTLSHTWTSLKCS